MELLAVLLFLFPGPTGRALARVDSPLATVTAERSFACGMIHFERAVDMAACAERDAIYLAAQRHFVRSVAIYRILCERHQTDEVLQARLLTAHMLRYAIGLPRCHPTTPRLFSHEIWFAPVRSADR